jgi:hypothetical protein
MINNKLFVFMILFIMSVNIKAQSLTSSVLPTSGGSAAAGDVQLNWTLGETFTPTLAGGSTIITQGFEQPELQIWTGNVNTTICAGSTITVPYLASGITSTANKFVAELSDAKGRFNRATTLGSIKENKNGAIIVNIPQNTVTGSDYRIRVRSTIAEFVAPDNGKSITISKVVAEIPDAYAYTRGVAVNTIYDGWLPASALTLKPIVSEGIGPFSYIWKNGAGVTVGKSDTYKVTAPDTYTVTIIDSKGCSSSAKKTIKLMNVRCGSDVQICNKVKDNFVTACVNSGLVANFLQTNLNSTLGSCSGTSTPYGTNDANIVVYPNPSTTTFTLKIESSLTDHGTLVVINAQGQVVEFRSNILPGQTVVLGNKYLPGIYYVEFMQKSIKKTVKLWKSSN